MRRIRPIVVAAVAVAVLLTAAPADAKRETTGTPKGRPATAVDVCCAWGRGISDGLTFSISAPSQAKSIMSSAVRSWASVVRGLKLQEVAVGRPADVRMSFKLVSGNTQGQAKIARDRSGFISAVEIFVAGSYRGRPNSSQVLGLITRHEFGHALGLKHANGDGDLMSPTIQAGVTGISSCDARAVQAAQQWFVTKSSEPHRPSASRVSC